MNTQTNSDGTLLSPPPCSRSFRAGDTVHHAPSGEDWLLATDEENSKVQACGWPESMAEAKDCQLLEPASDSERLDMLKTWAAEGKGYEHERDSRTRAPAASFLPRTSRPLQVGLLEIRETRPARAGYAPGKL